MNEDFQNRIYSFLLIFFLTFGACSPLRFQTEPIVNDGDWTTDGGGFTRSNSSSKSALAPPLDLAWTYNGAAGFSDSSPLYIDGNLYVGNRKGEVHVVEARSGKRIAIQGFGNSVEAAPLFHGGNLIVPNAWGKTVIKSYDVVKGNQRWSYKGPPIESGLIAKDGVLVTADIEGKVFALNTNDGREIWSFLPDSVAGYYSAPLDIDEGRIALADSDGILRAFDFANGNLLWAIECTQPVYANIASHKNLIFIPGSAGVLSAYSSADGSFLWSFDTGNEYVKFASPSVVDGLLVAGSTDGFLRAFDPLSGKLLWETQFDGAITSSPLIMRDYISVGTMTRDLYLVDRKSGKEEWTQKLRGRIKSAQLATEDRLIVMSEPKYIYGFSTMEQ